MTHETRGGAPAAAAASSPALDATQPIRTLSSHPSHPLPAVGAPVGSLVRTSLGSSDIEVFPIMLGGAEFGWNIDRDRGFAVLDRYRELGGNALHVADRFGAGRNELIVGQWIASRRARDEIVLAARVGGHPDNPGIDPTNLIRAVEASLTRLGTDVIDVLYLDARSYPVASVEDALATAEWLVEKGKARLIGAHGLSSEQLVEARILASAGFPRIEAVDVAYNLVRRGAFEGDMRRVVAAQGMSVTPSHPLEHGFLTGRYRDRAVLGGSSRERQVSKLLTRRGTRLLDQLDRIAAELGLPLAAVGVAWLLAQPNVAAPIVNAEHPSQVDELVRGVGARLSRAQRADLSRLSL